MTSRMPPIYQPLMKKNFDHARLNYDIIISSDVVAVAAEEL